MKGVWSDDTKRPRGSQHANAKMTEEQVAMVRELVRNGRSCRSLAARLGLNKSTIQRAVRCDSWRHVTSEE